MSVPTRARRTLVTSSLGTCLLLGGCAAPWESEPASAVDGRITLGFVNGGSTEFHTCLQESVERTARNNSVGLQTANSRQDAATEVANIERLIARDVDALIVQTVDVDALEDGIAKARAAGVPIFLTSVVPEDTSDVLGAVVVDQKEVGRLDAEWIEKDAAGRQVSVGVIAGAPGAASDVLVEAFTAHLPGNASVVASRPGMYDPVKARTVAAEMIRAQPGLDYAFVANEQMAFAARKAFDAAGGKDVRIVTVNGTDEALAALKDGRFAATVSNSAADTGELAVENVVSLLRKEKADKIDKTRVRLVTEDNADTAPLYCPPED
ncbi:sugar ABC transporter substrate-binding protein [Streptomyces phaeoluteigriseus]|uniref:Sugar ABC transporter substrate-binding protein n=1 Tax=Streptomyces phaeoluteigriseus TaxID=114686 RepID=A0A1V6MVK8_9ACTN|nr:sugar ABC transporter substrate-binding protein [Streptomyces phaeoluteigriseus]OQD56412.1 sugar ABC transporter substrate-binding protein [Streptomyces phaeoluteigriseus]